MSGYPKAHKGSPWGMLPLNPRAEEQYAKRATLYHCKACNRWFFRTRRWGNASNHVREELDATRGPPHPELGRHAVELPRRGWALCAGKATITRDKVLLAALRLGGEQAAREVLDQRGPWKEG